MEYLADMPRLTMIDKDTLNEWLNERAKLGWRLVTVYNGYFIFERPKQ